MLVASAMKEKVEEDVLKEPMAVSRVATVRRCLFSDVDHEINRRDLIRIREDLAKASKRRWNFDFENDCPLEGQFLWVPVEGGSLPSTTGSPPVAPSCPGVTLADCPPLGCDASREGLVGCVNFDLSVMPVESSCSSESTTGSIGINDSVEDMVTKSRRQQTTLRKYFRVKKRSAQKLKIATK